MYDLAFGPRHPRPPARRVQTREWEDPMGWVDLLLDAPRQVAANVEHNRIIAQHQPEWQRLLRAFDEQLEDVA